MRKFKDLFTELITKIENKELFYGSDKILASYANHKNKPSSIYTNEITVLEAHYYQLLNNSTWFFLDPTVGELGQWKILNIEITDIIEKIGKEYILSLSYINPEDESEGICYIDRIGSYRG